MIIQKYIFYMIERNFGLSSLASQIFTEKFFFPLVLIKGLSALGDN